MAASTREQEHIALQHRRAPSYEIESIPAPRWFLAALGVALLVWVLG